MRETDAGSVVDDDQVLKGVFILTPIPAIASCAYGPSCLNTVSFVTRHTHRRHGYKPWSWDCPPMRQLAGEAD